MEHLHLPLSGLRVIEMAGIGPCPLAGMLLADLGAEVTVIERPQRGPLDTGELLNRGKQRRSLDLKSAEGLAQAKALVMGADALIEGFRPGVMERLGLGPAAFAASHPRLVYGRVTGWGQEGPLAQAAGHDINYVALTGVLSIATRPGVAPSIPATLIGDMGGGAMFLAFGLVSALLSAQRTGQGRVVDAAMIDGVGMLSSLVHSLRAKGAWSDQPAQNFFLHSAPFYDSFECADGRYVTLGALEPPFFAELMSRLGLTDVDPGCQYDPRQWPALRERVAARIASKTHAAWCEVLEGSDACFAPVLSLAEAPLHPHAQARGSFVNVQGQWQPAAAPRFRPLDPTAGAPQVGDVTGESWPSGNGPTS